MDQAVVEAQLCCRHLGQGEEEELQQGPQRSYGGARQRSWTETQKCRGGLGGVGRGWMESISPLPTVAATIPTAATVSAFASPSVWFLPQSSAVPSTSSSIATGEFHSVWGARSKGRWISRQRPWASAAGGQNPNPAPNQGPGLNTNQAPKDPAKEEIKSGEEGKVVLEVGESSRGNQDRNLQVVCFNCGEIGHFSSACSRPRVCFICHSTNHVVEHCPAWTRPPMAAQYYGSANRGLGFYHIDVEPKVIDSSIGWEWRTLVLLLLKKVLLMRLGS